MVGSPLAGLTNFVLSARRPFEQSRQRMVANKKVLQCQDLRHVCEHRLGFIDDLNKYDAFMG